jgi:hypothetical protein
MDWIHLSRDRNKWQLLVKKNNGPSGVIKGGEFIG